METILIILFLLLGASVLCVFRYFKQILSIYQRQLIDYENNENFLLVQVENLKEDLRLSNRLIKDKENIIQTIQDKHSATHRNIKMEYGFIEPVRLKNTFEIGSYIVNNQKDPDEFLRDCIRRRVSSQIYDQLESNPRFDARKTSPR